MKDQETLGRVRSHWGLVVTPWRSNRQRRDRKTRNGESQEKENSPVLLKRERERN